jgi:hypothetical protein
MKTFEQSLNVLVERFNRTTNEEQGKQVFVDICAIYVSVVSVWVPLCIVSGSLRIHASAFASVSVHMLGYCLL